MLPGFGALIAHYCGAAVDSGRGVMLPPRRVVSFNESVDHNDGLLVSSVMRRNGIGYDAALSLVCSEINLMRHQLEVDGEMTLGRVGILKKFPGQPMEFVPKDSYEVLSAYAGLRPVAAVGVADRARRESMKEESLDIAATPRRWYGSLVRIAASIALLIGLGIVLSTPVTMINEPLSASLSAQLDTSVSQEPECYDFEYIDAERQYTGELAIAIPPREELAGTIAAEGPKTVAETGNDGVRFDDTDRYCLVIASLPTRALAEEYVAQSKEPQLGILEQDGKFRVYAATGTTTAEARNVTMTERYPDAWICALE